MFFLIAVFCFGQQADTTIVVPVPQPFPVDEGFFGHSGLVCDQLRCCVNRLNSFP